MHTLGRMFCLFILAVVWMFNLEFAEEKERSEEERPKHPRYRVYFPNYVLPLFLAVIVVLELFLPLDHIPKMLMSMCFIIFLHTCVYYPLLGAAMPLLRKAVNLRVCAVLWLLPNYLYLVTNSTIVPSAPKWAVYVPENLLRVLCLIWLIGFITVMGWKTAGHFLFRREILKDAREVEEPEILELWKDELERAGYPGKWYDLVRSPEVKTPLTIGFLAGTTRVVLPERSYTPEELRLIFRHELVHIGREDSTTKFFFAFCTAMCWFNPLVWWAMRKSADDLELSCDETVLLDAPEPKRRQYAQLILRTAGDERGFTTCLSASARALRYRLHWVMQPTKRFTGSLIAGAVLFVLLFSCGHVALAFERMTGAELIFGGEDPAQFEIEDNEAAWFNEPGHYWPRVEKPDELKEYLASLEVYEVADFYDFYDHGAELTLTFRRGEQRVRVALSDHELYVSGTHHDAQHYFLPEDVDWTYVESLLYTGASSK